MSVAITPKKMVPGSALTASAATYYTVGADVSKAVVKEIEFCNTDTVNRTVTMYIIPSAGSAAAANTVYYQITLQAGETKTFSRSTVMLTGGFIQALASSAGVVSFNASGVEYT